MTNFFTEIINKPRKLFLYYSLSEAFLLVTLNIYLIPLLVEYNLKNISIGFFIAFTYLAGGFVGLIFSKIVSPNNRKLLLIKTILIQTIFLGLISLFLFLNTLSALIIIFSFIAFLIQISYFPVSYSLYGDIIKEGKHDNVFLGLRDTLVETICLISSMIYAFFLETDRGFFKYIFLIAFIGRILSLNFLRKFENKKIYFEEHSFKEFLLNLNNNNFGLFAEFLFFFYFAIYISLPFFTPYMLRELNFNYLQYFLINSMISFITIFFSPLIGSLIDKFEQKSVLITSSLIISLIPLLWTLTRNFYILLIFEFVGGIGWVGFLLSVNSYLITYIKSEIRHKASAYVIFIRNIGIALGGILASLLIKEKITIQGIFIISFVLRLLAVILFGIHIKKLKEIIKNNLLEKLLRKILSKREEEEIKILSN
ncbi:MAG: MFS transporter [Candidatus Woesearchaeota archaeon]